MSTVSNGCIIDEFCKHKNGTIVGSNASDAYSCTLNQTSISDNKNKFYIMQLIKNGGSYVHFIRFGRIGENGKSSHDDVGTNEEYAKKIFEKQFQSKTKNKWLNRKNFVKHAGKYFMAEISYDDELKDVNTTVAKTIKPSDLDERVQDLIRMLSDVDMMQNALVQMEIDTKKLPLGKIKQSQLKSASELLTEIRKLIQKYKKATDDKEDTDEIINEIERTSSEYYTYVPFACGRRKPPVIDTDELVAKYDDVIDDLMNIVVTTKITENKTTDDKNPLDNIYNEMNTTITPVIKGSDTWDKIETYINNTHAPTHAFKLKLYEVYEISRLGEEKIFNKHCKNIDNRQLLIHGSRMSNWVSILKNGLMLDPSRLGVMISGKMFGYGIYFANSFSKSAQYCGSSYGANEKIALTLAEVALGTESKRTQSDYYISKDSLKKLKADSTWGQGKSTPSSYGELNGISIPQGKLTASNINSCLQYDEKIVYDVSQICLRYLVIADMTYK